MRMILVLPKPPSFKFAPAVVERDPEWPGAVAYCFGGNRHIGPQRFDSWRRWMLWQAARAAGMV